MNNTTKEQISALIDNELEDADRDSLFNAMRPGSEELAEWERMHRVSAVLRGMMPDEPGFADGSLADRIRTALKDEPTRLAPGQASTGSDVTASEVQDEQVTDAVVSVDHAKSPRRRRKVAGWIGSLAVAASVSAIVLFGFDIGITGNPDAGTPADPTTPVAAVTPVSTVDDGVVVWPASSTRWESVADQSQPTSAVLLDSKPQDNNAARNRRLNALLVAHAEFSPASAMNGMSAYARFVSYDPVSQGAQPTVTQ